MNENINLVELLKDCPKGTRMYSSVFGKDTFLVDVNLYKGNPLPITICGKHEFHEFHLSTYGHPFADAYGECCLWPSEGQRDWSKWQCPKPKFDPKTLQPFDKVLAASMADGRWVCDFFSHIGESIRDSGRLYVGTGFGAYDRMIPYNDDTKHLAGTAEEAPEYYRYWEE